MPMPPPPVRPKTRVNDELYQLNSTIAFITTFEKKITWKYVSRHEIVSCERFHAEMPLNDLQECTPPTFREGIRTFRYASHT